MLGLGKARADLCWKGRAGSLGVWDLLFLAGWVVTGTLDSNTSRCAHTHLGEAVTCHHHG